MFNKYKELKYQINDLQKATGKFRDELYELKDIINDHDNSSFFTLIPIVVSTYKNSKV